MCWYILKRQSRISPNDRSLNFNVLSSTPLPCIVYTKEQRRKKKATDMVDKKNVILLDEGGTNVLNPSPSPNPSRD